MNDVPRAVETWAITRLRHHPRQQELIGDLPGNEIEQLAESIKTTGLQNPIHILPDGTIVDGHQRLRALTQLGRTEVDVVVRHDLVQRGEASILSFLIQSSLVRRQMDPLAVARAFRQLKEIARERTYEELGYDDRRDIRDQIAERLGGHYSGRTLDRYEQILNMPRALQDAVLAKQLPLTMAVKFTKQSRARKQAIVDRIEAGEPARKVMEEFVKSKKCSQRTDPGDRYRNLVTSLSAAVEGLSPYVDDVAGGAGDSAEVIAVLDRSSKLIQRLREAESAYRDGAYDAFDDDSDVNS